MSEKRDFNPRNWSGESLTVRLLACWELERDCSSCELTCPFAKKQKSKTKERTNYDAKTDL